MEKALSTIKEQISIYEMALQELRDKYDETNANNPYVQVVIAQDIACVAAKLDAVKHLYKIMGGV